MICPNCSNQQANGARCAKCGNEMKDELALAYERIDRLQKLVDQQAQWLIDDQLAYDRLLADRDQVRKDCSAIARDALQDRRRFEQLLKEREVKSAT